ncbi:hypothetical protein HDV03_005050 [Kappamyces sp. JEL0829]|nr:hypothetical protein HDV03_005050 [Kappamyces sp. JEL0829]
MANRKAYRAFCNTLFFLKALVAVLLGWGALGYQAYLVANLYSQSPKPLPPVGFPAVGSADAARCFFNPALSKARLEPPKGSFFFGFSPQWVDGELPSDVAARLGTVPPLFNSFVSMNQSDFQPNIIEWNCQQVGQLGGVLELTLMPTIRASEIPDNFYAVFAQFMRRMNSQYGVPILLRFMHEMNGNWMTYGMQPTAQKIAWQKLVLAIRAQTNMTGDDLVDWIGISLYDVGRNADGSTKVVPANIFTDPTSSVSLFASNFNFYNTYVQTKGKPFMFSETGAAVDSNLPGQPQVVSASVSAQLESQTKQSWWMAILNSSLGSSPSMPLLKAAVWFEEFKSEAAYQNANARIMRDYRISANSSVRNAFLSDLKSFDGKITSPGKFSFSCDGRFNIV